MVLSFQEAREHTTEGKPLVLLGNGFSMAWCASVFG